MQRHLILYLWSWTKTCVENNQLWKTYPSTDAAAEAGEEEDEDPDDGQGDGHERDVRLARDVHKTPDGEAAQVLGASRHL